MPRLAGSTSSQTDVSTRKSLPFITQPRQLFGGQAKLHLPQ